MDAEERIKIEKDIIGRVVISLLADGNIISVQKCDVIVLRRCTDAKAIKDAMMSGGTDTLHVHNKNGRGMGWVTFIYGRHGWDVIADYGESYMAKIIKPIEKYAHKLAK